ncbi:hypothetical protein [Rubripirellula amarantea]|uniref:hypothetical protein n=1 Tax=Rubripirellula amarantea TaxID=2527999 RepID=UPI0011B6083F|nr:hypothetical protein [Rubripirellula amarantea]
MTRPNTVNALNSLFGSTKIDFDNHAHVRVYYEQLGKLMIVVDPLLNKQLSNNFAETYGIPEGVKLLMDWQVKVCSEAEIAVQ